jgi:hypothetical protein
MSGTLRAYIYQRIHNSNSYLELQIIGVFSYGLCMTAVLESTNEGFSCIFSVLMGNPGGRCLRTFNRFYLGEFGKLFYNILAEMYVHM